MVRATSVSFKWIWATNTTGLFLISLSQGYAETYRFLGLGKQDEEFLWKIRVYTL